MIDMTRTTRKELDRKIRKGVTLIDFNAPWCAPCRAQEPVILALEQQYGRRATIAKLNIDENQEMAMNLGIQSIPTMILYREGCEIGRFIGLQSTETLSRALGEALKGLKSEVGGQRTEDSPAVLSANGS
ncbi:MAG: thioredoxin family protein [Desulfobacterales bacterium]|jgi:thioredoxin 1